jgi:glutamate-ammonia-ligase adenylyltransferase
MTGPVPLEPDRLMALVDDPGLVRLWLAGLGLRDPERAARDLRDLARRGLPADAMARVLGTLLDLLPRSPDAGMALTNFERFLAAHPEPAGAVARLADDPRAMEVLVQVLGTSQHFSEQIIRDPALFDWLRQRPARRDRWELVEDVAGEVRRADDPRAALRRFKAREMLRIGYDDIVRGVPLETTALDLSHLAEACVEAAYRLARRRAAEKHGDALGPDGPPARFVVLALGKLGGAELNYSSDIDLIFLYDEEGQTRGPRPVSHAEFFARVGAEIVRLLSDSTPLGQAYRVDMRLRPDGDQGPLARSLAATLGYYETTGRTWERQALIKCRPIAGDLDLGATFAAVIAPFVYRRYLTAAEIAEIQAMKRRIELRTASAGEDEVEVKTGRGGIRDVEFVVQFLQLLHGGEYPEVRSVNTLAALAKLERVGCLTVEERTVMEETYRFLRRVEHRLQTMFDLQTHRMPREAEARRTLAIRLGYPPANPWEDSAGPSQRFFSDYRVKTDRNREILNHLLHDAFHDDEGLAPDPVVDLVFDPEPRPEAIDAILGVYPFRDRETAYKNVLALAREEHEFLSPARCRHFFAAIAPRLLQAIGRTPDPDLTLNNLEKVSASLGAKAILWELFNFLPQTLQLYVDLCANSPFLTELLITNPGMIDELMDSLVVNRPQPAAAIRAELAELCRGAEDLAPILMSFRNKEWVRIGARDLLRRGPIAVVTRELADVAEAIVVQVARWRWDRQVARQGVPLLAATGRRARWAILGLGKLGGRELGFLGDLDLVFLYEGDGATSGPGGPVANDQFFGDLVRGILKSLGGTGDRGPLYAVDTRLRPHGSSGALAVSLDAFRRYYEGTARPWERLALTRARVLFSTGRFGATVNAMIQEFLTAGVPEPGVLAQEVVAMRRRQEDHARTANDLKRGLGGQADIEFLVQYLQLVHGREHPGVLRPNLGQALESLRRSALLDERDADDLRSALEYLRTVEGRLRALRLRAAVDLPDDPLALGGLARRLGYSAGSAGLQGAAFRADLERHAARTRAIFERVVAVAATATGANS